MRTYYRGRGCINASWPTWPQAVWSLSESPLTESGTAVCLYGLLFGAELPVCHFLWDTELCGYEGQKGWLLLALSNRLWHVGCGRSCARMSVCMCVLAGIQTLSLNVYVCVCVCKTVWLNLSPFCLVWLLSWRLTHKQESVRSAASQATSLNAVGLIPPSLHGK